jgi:sugar phosphate permease
MGYVGAAMGDYFTGRSLDASSWEKTIYLWAGWAFASAIAAGMLWNASSTDEDHSRQT